MPSHHCDGAPLTVAADSAARFSRHAPHRCEGLIRDVARSRSVVQGGRRLRVPVGLDERPPWDMSHRGKGKNYFEGDWSNLDRLPQTVHTLMKGKVVEWRLHAAFALARCSHQKEHRVQLATAPGVTEALGHVLRHSEPTDSGRRMQHHALTTLHNVLLEAKKVDVFIGHDDDILGGLLNCLESCDLPLQELAVACIDFLAVSAENQPVLCFKTGLLDALCHLMRTTSSGYAVYHCLHAITYLSTCRQAHHCLARHRGVVEVLLDTLCEHREDPARCAQGAIAICNLMSTPENAAAVEAEYDINRVVQVVLREARDGSVLAYCKELDSRVRNRDVGGAPAPVLPQPSETAKPPPRAPSSGSSLADATPMKEAHVGGAAPSTMSASKRGTKQRVSFVDPHDSTILEGGVPEQGRWGAFDAQWESAQAGGGHREVREVRTVSPGRVHQSRHHSPDREPSLDPMALLDRYEAELNATMAEIDRGAGHLSPPKRPASAKKLPAYSRSPSQQRTPPAFGAMLSLDDSDDDSPYSAKRGPPRYGAAGRYGLGTFAVASPNVASDMWSVSGDSDV
eukprot:TRINITY_DN13543_c0_g1_i1.p1 TRINITY_DN13543_c0_g1~~TRINITY_DN13543_c0_g1_i1.p1  ORF type:complete len:568 (+),score=178.18 TRINITY_DN13543_c0_g1_i1:70-1773(+)